MWFLQRHDGKYCKVKDPREVLANTGWIDPFLSRKQVKSRLCSIAVSLTYEYWGPIFNSLARYIYRRCRTTHAIVRSDWYVAEKLKQEGIEFRTVGTYMHYTGVLKEEVWIKPDHDDRLEFSNMFSISPEMQLEIEAYLDNKTDDSPLDHPSLDRLFTGTDYHRFVALHRR